MLRIAFGASQITPSEPSYLCGHAVRTGLSKGVLDNLMCSVVVLEQDGQRYCLASIELAGLDKPLVDRFRAVAEARGIPASQVIIGATHTHAGPEYLDEGIFTHDPNAGARPGYRDYLVGQFGAALDAADSFTEVQPGFGSLEVEGYYGNRNDRLGPVDRSANLIEFRDATGRRVAAIVNLSVHPTVLGPQNMLISGDLFGAVRRRLTSAWGCPVMLFNGAEGDVSTRFWRRGEDESELARVAAGVGAQLERLTARPLKDDAVGIRDLTYHFDYVMDQVHIHSELDRAREMLKTTTDPLLIKTTSSGLAMLEVLVNADPHVVEDLRAKLIHIGELRIVAIECELFSSYGLQIKESIPGGTIIWGLADGSIGYLVTPDAYGHTYESLTTPIPKGGADAFVAHIIEQMKTA